MSPPSAERTSGTSRLSGGGNFGLGCVELQKLTPAMPVLKVRFLSAQTLLKGPLSRTILADLAEPRHKVAQIQSTRPVRSTSKHQPSLCFDSRKCKLGILCNMIQKA